MTDTLRSLILNTVVGISFSILTIFPPAPEAPCLSSVFPSDRVVDDLNPVLTFTRREVESLLHFVEEEPEPTRVQLQPQDSMESVLRKVLRLYPHLITKVGAQREKTPFIVTL